MFKNKVVVITGASSGIGAEMALAFAREGAQLVVTYKENKAGAEKVASEAIKLGVRAAIVQADLINEADAKNVVEETIKEFGRLDVLINNAGRYVDGDEWNGDSGIWTKSLKQNLVSVMSMSKYAAEVFNKQKSGVIVNIASRLATQGAADALSYSAAKAGVANITQSYAKLLAPFGRANAVSPGAANAGYWLDAPKDELEEVLQNVPLQKLVEPSDIAEMVLFLASDKAKNITGQNILVDGGFSLK